MTQRLTPEREAARELREYVANWLGLRGQPEFEHWIESPDDAAIEDPRVCLRELCEELASLRAELAGAEERGAARERAATVTYLRTTPAHWPLGDTPWRGAALDIERGDHAPAGTAAADAGEPGPARPLTVAEAQLHGDPAVIRQAEIDALSGRTR